MSFFALSVALALGSLKGFACNASSCIQSKDANDTFKDHSLVQHSFSRKGQQITANSNLNNSLDKCCWGGCDSYTCKVGTWCATNKDRCTGPCNGLWCPASPIDDHSEPEENITGKLTFYAFADNCPPSAVISHPTLHQQAGGIGTYKDPITCASAPAWLPKGTKVYVPHYKKYFIMEDDCEQCINDFEDTGLRHIDGWMGPHEVKKATTDCEGQLEVLSTTFILNPSPSYDVDVTPFFSCDDTSCSCMEDIVEHCDDSHDNTRCGNYCTLDHDVTCQEAATKLGLSLERFKALNAEGNENKKFWCWDDKTSADGGYTIIEAGTSMCQSGFCGGR